MNMHEMLKGKKQNSKRVGRGRASGHGKTSGRGHNGQKSRTSNNIPVGFEGGQMPLKRRLPKAKGFKHYQKTIIEIVNLQDLDVEFVANDKINKESLQAKGLIKNAKNNVKVLALGKTSKSLFVSADAFSAKAKQMVEKAGGKCELIGDSQNRVAKKSAKKPSTSKKPKSDKK